MLTVRPLVCTKHLRKSSDLAMWSSGLGGRRGLEKFQRPRRRPRPGSSWGGSRGCRGPVWVLTCGGNNAGGRAQRRPAAPAAGGFAPASLQLGLGNTRVWELRMVLGEVLVARVWRQHGRRVGLTEGTNGGGNGGAAAPCTRARRGRRGFYS
jgi:hypothetical protein